MEGTEWQGKRGIRVTLGRQEAHGAADELGWELGCSVLDWAQPGYCREWILQAPSSVTVSGLQASGCPWFQARGRISALPLKWHLSSFFYHLEKCSNAGFWKKDQLFIVDKALYFPGQSIPDHKINNFP